MTLTTLRLLPDLEAAITRLPGVQAARVVTSGDAKPLEIHVLAEGGKHPKQVVRDIQSMAIAAFDLEVDHRIVSVVQMEGDAGALTRPRPVLASLTIRTVGAERTVTVTLGVQSELYDGVASGPATASALPRQVALATLRSLGVAAGLESCDVEQAEIVEVSGRALASSSSRRWSTVTRRRTPARPSSAATSRTRSRAPSSTHSTAA